MRFLFAFLILFSNKLLAQYSNGFTLSLDGFGNHFLSSDCEKKSNSSRCPDAIRRLAQDDKEDRAFIVKSRAEICKSNIQSASPQDPWSLNELFQQKRFSSLGEYTHKIAQKCTTEFDASNLISKFYYYNARLNLGADKIIQERLLIAHYLGKEKPKCPDPLTLGHASQNCEQFQKCDHSESLIDIAQKSEANESLFHEAQDQLKKLPSNCDSHNDCRQNKAALSGMIIGLQRESPWLANSDFIKSKNKKSTHDRLKEYFKSYDKDLETLSNKIQSTAICTHGSSKCDIGEMREVLALMPELPDEISRDRSLNSTSQYMSMQSCLEEGSLDRNKTGKVMNETYLNIGLTLATLGVGAIANSARLGFAATRNGRLAIEAANLSVDSVNLFMSGKDVIQSCFKNLPAISFQQPTKNNICDTGTGSLSQSSRDQGACLVSAGLGAVSGLVMVPGALRAANIYREAHAAGQNGRRSTDLVQPDRRTSSVTRVLTEPEGKNIGHVEIGTIPNPPEHLKVTGRINEEGTKTLFYDSVEKASNGKLLKTPKELQIDPLTGAIDANFPSGREYFDKLVKEKSGKAYLAFVDVGSLGAVNKTFAKGSEAGDQYLKSVADKIMKNGEGKVTLARLGGDEFGLLIEEKDPTKVKAILEKIQESIRKDHSGEAKKVFHDEKVVRAADYRANPSPENRARIDELSRIQQPDISIGSTQIGASDDLGNLLARAETQAKDMKIKTTLQFGRSAEKYGSKQLPNERPNPMYMADVDAPIPSTTWYNKRLNTLPTNLDKIPYAKNERVDTVNRFSQITLAKYKDELGHESYRVERLIHNKANPEKTVVSYEIPTRGDTGLLDATHPQSQSLIHEHFTAAPNNALVMPKLTSLRYLNYFESGTEAGDRILAAVAREIKRETRGSDLTFKGAGADFIWSMGQPNSQQISKTMDRINKGLENSPIVKDVIDNEKKIVREKMNQAVKMQDQEAIQILDEKLKYLETFKPKVEYEILRRHELGTKDTYKDAIQKLDDKFRNHSK